MLEITAERDTLRRQVEQRAGGKHGATHRAVMNASEAMLFRAVTTADQMRAALAHVEQLADFAAHLAAGGDPDEGRRDRWKARR